MDIADDSNEQSTLAAAEGVLFPRGTQTAQADLLAVNKVEHPMEVSCRKRLTSTVSIKRSHHFSFSQDYS